MLDRCLTIPVVLGLCLGAIMFGVQISAGALGAAIDDHGVTSLVSIENNHECSVVRVLGKRMAVDALSPLDWQNTAALLGEKAAWIYSAVSEAFLRWCKRLIDFSGLL